MDLQGHKNAACESRSGYISLALSLVCLDSAGVWLSCQAINWISVLARLFQVLANPVTYFDRFSLHGYSSN